MRRKAGIERQFVQGSFHRKEHRVPCCKRIKDHSIIACAKCFKRVSEKDAEFSPRDQIEFGGHDGLRRLSRPDCAQVKLMNEVAKDLGRDIDTLHLGHM
jgi:hypothetical protein